MTPGDKVAGLFEKSHLGMQDATRNSETVKSAVSAAFGSLHYIYIHYCNRFPVPPFGYILERFEKHKSDRVRSDRFVREGASLGVTTAVGRH